MKQHLIWTGLIVLALALGGCAPSRSPQDRAEWFFDKGESTIIKSLKKQDISDEALTQARQTIDRHRPVVVRDLTAFMDSQYDMFSGLVAGKETNDLLALERSLHDVHQRTLRSIGSMHEDLAKTVGAPAWQAASAYREARLDKRTK